MNRRLAGVALLGAAVLALSGCAQHSDQCAVD